MTKTKSIEIVPVKTNLIIDFDPKKQRLNPEIQKEIDDCFKSKINCFDGALIHVKKIEIGKKIRFSTQIGSYKDFIGTQHRRPNSIGKIHGRQDYCMPLSIGAIVITKNNKIIVAKRKKTNLNSNYWSFPAEGYLDPNKHLINNEISVFNGIAAELKEELGIHINEVKTFHILGIVYDKEITKQPYIATIWKTNLKTFDIKNLFKKTEKEEFEEIDFIDNNRKAFNDFINKHELTLHNLGKAMLYRQYMGWSYW